MKLRSLGFSWCVAILLSTTAPSGAAASEPLFAGQNISRALDHLRTQGLTFIYNSELVPQDLKVLVEPQARDGIELAREILAQHRLDVIQVVPGVYSVVQVRHAVRNTDSAADDSRAEPPSAPQFEEVVVNSSRYTIGSDLGTHDFLTQDELQRMPHLGDEPLRAVQRLPGVASDGLSALLHVRGGAADETSIVLDGLRLYEPFHLRDFLSPVSLLDSRIVDSIEVYAGALPASHGGSMSGVIELNSVRAERPRYYELALSLFHASGLGSMQFADGRGEAVFSLRRSNAGLLVHAAESDFGTPNYSDAFAKLSYQLTLDTRASLQTLLSGDRISVRRNAGAQQAQAEYRNAYTWATLSHDWSAGSNSRLLLSVSDVASDRVGTIDRPDLRAGRLHDDREFRILGLQLDNQLSTGLIEHRFGASVQYVAGKYDYTSASSYAAGFPFPDSPSQDLTRESRTSPNGLVSSLYWDVRRALGERVTIEAGVRLDRQTYAAGGAIDQISPRLSILHKLGPGTRLRASAGRYYQAQGINELQVEDGLDNFNPPQYVDHTILSFEHELSPMLSLRLEGYRKEYRRPSPRFENLFDPLVLLPELEFDRVRVDPSRARAQGVELLLKFQPTPDWSAWLSYARSRALDRIDNRDVPRSWDQRDALGAGFSFSTGPWSVSSTYTYRSGWPMTGLDVVSASDRGLQAIIGQRNERSFSNFSSLDVRATRTFTMNRGVMDVFVEVTNALSQSNPCCTEYYVRRNGANLDVRSRVDNWLPLVPSAGVLWRF